ncbi:hypothetical protein MBLNU13_g01423t1 [Cladosporium sp. NU13]
MRYAVASTLALAAAVVATPVAQGVTEQLKPESSAPSGCSPSYDGEFEIQVVNVTQSASKRSLSKRQQADAEKLEITLKDGVLTDSKDRTGYIAANNQFQFDGPAQTGAIYTAGWSACSNGSLALGGTTVFFQCLSGDFYNLYDKSTGEQCNEVHINIVKGGASGASQAPDGQPQETPAPVSQISDGQVQASTSGAPVSQISDGQVQASTAAATGAPVSQIPDGQIQASTSGAAVSQIPDGQVQAAPTVSPVSQIPDGQVQAPYSNGTATKSAAPSGTGVSEQPAPFEGSASKAYTAGAAAVVALFGLVVAL